METSSLFMADRPDLVMPRYDGRSIANIPAAIAAWLGAPALPGLPPLDHALWEPHAPARRVILLVLDAVGYETFRRCFTHSTVESAQALTSVFPSTTVAALASLWTGRAPAQHGLVGTRMWMHDYGILAQMISLKAASKGYPEQLVAMGLEPESFLPAPNLPEHLAAAGIPTHDYIPHYIKNSGLTRILHRGVRNIHPVADLAEAVSKLCGLLESAPGQPMYVHIYHSTVDTMAHYDGPDTRSIAAELGVVSYLLQSELIGQLSPQAAQGTLLIITADHGQIYTPLDRAVALHKHPDLWRHLVMPPGGEPRAGYLFVRDGHKQAVRAYFEQNLAYAVDVLDTRAALEAELWGPVPHHSQIKDRLGDLLILLRENYWVADPFGETPPFLGWHGGLAAEEMNVPFLPIDLARLV